MQSDEITGNYIFVERVIITDAVVLAGDSTRVRPSCFEPSLFYDFYPEEKVLEYSLGPEMPVNKDLELVFGDKHFYLPPYAGCGGGSILLTPVYYLHPIVALDGSMIINEFDKTSGRIGISYSPQTSEILLNPSETFQETFENIRWVRFSRFDGGAFISDSALVKYVDRVVVKNWGFAPRNKIVRKAP
ncbi:hypothetical protein EDS67_03910 [candidate division KSB1 bacterium]|nr:MAG: hypothetical protein EDS67_03910 [candidate division KSB1 bacterium]MBC6947531.1 hypothetical protein [candidate division KSB1 bacterium]MCE7940072.1 hypothetical protein [Chlorobi bacterium CHB1]